MDDETLHQRLAANLDDDGLRMLCQHLVGRTPACHDLDAARLTGKGIEGRTRSLVSYCRMRQSRTALLDSLHEVDPNILGADYPAWREWTIAQDAIPPPPTGPHSSERRQRHKAQLKSLISAMYDAAIVADWPQVISISAAIAELHPGGQLPQNAVVAVSMWLGDAYYTMGDYRQALTGYTNAINGGRMAVAYCKRGNAYYARRRYNLAMEDYNRAIRVQPDYSGAYYGRGSVYFMRGQCVAAIIEYNLVIELDPGFALAYYQRGSAYDQLGYYKQAFADYGRAIHYDQSLAAPAYNRRGNIRYARKHYGEAMEDYNRAIRADPSFASAYFNRANLYLRQGERLKASRDYAKAVELSADAALKAEAEQALQGLGVEVTSSI